MKPSIKRNASIVALALTLAIVPMGLVACGPGAPQAESYSTETAAGMPPLMPADTHQTRWETGGFERCYSCHGAGEKANPIMSKAVAIPEDHYVGGSASQNIDDARKQCVTCHPLG